MHIYVYIVKVLKGYNQVDSVYFDFSKAFDSVNHDLLIFKLSKLGIFGKSFISNNIFCSVLQGSSIKPLSFILFINDITQG